MIGRQPLQPGVFVRRKDTEWPSVEGDHLVTFKNHMVFVSVQDIAAVGQGAENRGITLA